jgi:general secretion pathway protein C
MLAKRLPLLCALLLSALIAGGVTFQLLPYFQSSQSALKQQKTATKSIAPTQTKPANRNIASFNLFGSTSLEVKNAPIAPKTLPKTSLKLKLTGVLASPSPDEASALIEGPDRDTENYAINDELPGGATLKQVYPDRVVIERSGRLENLVFVESKSIGIQSYIPPEEDDLDPRDQVTPASLPAATSGKPTTARTQGIKDRLSKLRKRMLQNRTNQ